LLLLSEHLLSHAHRLAHCFHHNTHQLYSLCASATGVPERRYPCITSARSICTRAILQCFP